MELPHYRPDSTRSSGWHYLRRDWLANSVFPSLTDIINACETVWNRFATDHGLIRSLCAVA